MMTEIRVSGGIGRFLRVLTGLDRAAAKAAFDEFIANRTMNANQLGFLDLVIDSLTENGAIAPRVFYESPFTDLDAMGATGIFGKEDAQKIVAIVHRLNEAVAA